MSTRQQQAKEHITRTFTRNYTFYVCLPAPLTKQALKLEDLPVDVQEVRYHYRNGQPAGEAHAQDG